MTDYRSIFDAFETSLIRHSSLPEAKLREELAAFRIDSSTTFTDEIYFDRILTSIFYSGMRADTVTGKLPTIRRYLLDWQTTSKYTDVDIDLMMANPDMLRNRRKITFAIENARVFQEIVDKHSSFANYIASFQAHASFENLMFLKEELEYRLSGLGPITTYHFMTDIGLPVLKPDRVICRIFLRLGLIDDVRQLLKTVIQGRKFAAATGHPIRYIDIVFVSYGQAANADWGMTRGICLGEKPSCQICSAKVYCNYYGDRLQAQAQ